MKYSTRSDINAPIDQVFTATTDFRRFERKLRNRGIKIARMAEFDSLQVGATWRVNFQFRGKSRDLVGGVTEISAPESLCIEGKSQGGILVITRVELIELSKSKTRMKVQVELLPKTIPARLFIQSLKFAKGNLDGRFAERISALAKDIENVSKRRPGAQ